MSEPRDVDPPAPVPITPIRPPQRTLTDAGASIAGTPIPVGNPSREPRPTESAEIPSDPRAVPQPVHSNPDSLRPSAPPSGRRLVPPPKPGRRDQLDSTVPSPQVPVPVGPPRPSSLPHPAPASRAPGFAQTLGRPALRASTSPVSRSSELSPSEGTSPKLEISSALSRQPVHLVASPPRPRLSPPRPAAEGSSVAAIQAMRIIAIGTEESNPESTDEFVPPPSLMPEPPERSHAVTTPPAPDEATLAPPVAEIVGQAEPSALDVEGSQRLTEANGAAATAANAAAHLEPVALATAESSQPRPLLDSESSRPPPLPPRRRGSIEPGEISSTTAAVAEPLPDETAHLLEDTPTVRLPPVSRAPGPPPRRSLRPDPVGASGTEKAPTAPAENPSAQPAATPLDLPKQRLRKPWWEELFGEDFSRAQARLSEHQVQQEVTFIEESLGVGEGGIILDLGCGAGYHATELASRGYGVVGYDLSLYQLALATDVAHDAGQKLNLLQGDMREMAFEEMFDGIYCWNTSFGYFEEDKNVLVAQRVLAALKSGGTFLVDVINRDFATGVQPSSVWYEGDSCVCMDDMTVDFITSRLRVKRSLILDDGKTRECSYSIRLYSLHELGKLLHDVGFRVTEASGHPATRGVFLGESSPRIIMLAQKP